MRKRKRDNLYTFSRKSLQKFRHGKRVRIDGKLSNRSSIFWRFYGSYIKNQKSLVPYTNMNIVSVIWLFMFDASLSERTALMYLLVFLFILLQQQWKQIAESFHSRGGGGSPTPSRLHASTFSFSHFRPPFTSASNTCAFSCSWLRQNFVHLQHMSCDYIKRVIELWSFDCYSVFTDMVDWMR